MLEFLKDLLDFKSPPPEPPGPKALRKWVAVLLLEAAYVDGHMEDEERARINTLLRHNFDLTEAEADDLITRAAETVDTASDLYQVTRNIKNALGHADRIAVVEMLWDVAYRDGHVHDLEASLVRRATGLLHVTDHEAGAARKRVLARHGIHND